MKHRIENIAKTALLAVFLGVVPVACSDDDEALNNDTRLGSISLEGASVERDDVNQTMLVTVPETMTDLSSVKLSFALPQGATALINGYEKVEDGEAVVNLNSPVKLAVVAANGDRANWTIAATNNSYTLAYGMGYMLAESKSLLPARGEEYSPYLNQYENTPAPNDNCGPACAAMAVNWGHTRAKMTAEMARSFNPAVAQWTATNCKDCINMYGGGSVHAEMTELPFFYYSENVVEEYTNFLKETIDGGRLVITVVNNADNTYNPNPEQHTHRFYQSDANHILLYKGYRVVDGVTWIEVYDSGGVGEEAKYADGAWKGENRYYLASDLAKAIVNKKIGIVATVWHD